MLFRDREISDAFGFVYHKTTPESAADDVLRRLRNIVRETAQEEIVIGVILDGENPWEHYHDGGERFLSLLYSAFSQRALDQEHSVAAQSTTVSEAMTAAPPSQHLSCLHSGSWINTDYKIWIGHEEDNRGWDILGHTRARLAALAPNLPPDRARAAWNELYAAEGSDWFWWYGDDFETDFKSEFDRLFRTHLRNVWTHMGLTPPDQLSRPVCTAASAPETESVVQPRSLLSPTIDGVVTDFLNGAERGPSTRSRRWAPCGKPTGCSPASGSAGAMSGFPSGSTSTKRHRHDTPACASTSRCKASIIRFGLHSPWTRLARIILCCLTQPDRTRGWRSGPTAQFAVTAWWNWPCPGKIFNSSPDRMCGCRSSLWSTVSKCPVTRISGLRY